MLSDSDLVAELLAREVDAGLSLGESPGRGTRSRRRGFFDGDLRGQRGPRRARPLRLSSALPGATRFGGRSKGWIVASESPALDVVGASFVREINPGEMVTITKDGVTSVQLLEPALGTQKLCIFEFVYFARPDAYLMGHQVHTTRRRMGELLAGQSTRRRRPRDGRARLGRTGRRGIRQGLGHPLRLRAREESLHRTYVHRARSETRERRACGENSIRCARTSRVSASSWWTTPSCAARRPRHSSRCCATPAPKEVHLRISSPPFTWPCYYGIDTPTRDELLAANHSVAEMNDFIGSDSLEFITLENLRAAIQAQR